MGQTTQNTLPDTYYLDYFNFLLDFVFKNYSDILCAREKIFYDNFRNLSFSAQCMFVRFANRKGVFFRESKLVYQEIENIGLSIEELCRNNFVSYDNIDQTENHLFLFTKPEIISIGKARGWDTCYKKSQKKEDIIFSIIEQIDHSDINAALFDEDRIIFFESEELVNFYKLLFFGDQYNDMTQFVIRDIGNIKLENLENVTFTPNFYSRAEVDDYLTVSAAYRVFKELKELVSPLKCYQWFTDQEIVVDPPYSSRPGKMYVKLILKLAKLLEQHGFNLEALDIYLKINVSPARERQVRLYSKLNEPEKATMIAEQILECPHNASETLFAKDFLNAGTNRIKRSTTLTLKSANEITLERDPQTSVEHLAVAYFVENGFEAYHTENSLWRFLFGLLFWEETYDTELSTFHHPLQRLPSDIHDISFYDKRADAINAKLKTVRTRKVFIEKIKDTYHAKLGIAHGYIYWSDDLLKLALKAIELLPLKGLKEVLKMIAIQVKSNTTGFPDLFIFRNKSYYFYEIKSPTDQLSAQQLFWIDFMNKWNIRSEVLKVTWK